MSVDSTAFYNQELSRQELAALVEAEAVTANAIVEGLYHAHALVRRNAAGAAALVDDLPDPGKALLRICAGDPDETVRGWIVKAMAQGDYPVGLAATILFGALLDPVDDISDEALSGLELRMNRQPAQVIPLLVAGLRDPRPLISSVCADLLVKAGDKAAGALVPLLSDADPLVRRGAFDVLEDIRWQAASELLDAMRDPVARPLACRLLGGMAELDPPHVAIVEGYAGDADPALAEAAALLLGALRAPKRAPSRTEPLEVPIPGFFDGHLGAAALAAAADVPVDDLLYATRDGRDQVRANAVGLLARSQAARDSAGAVVDAVAPLVRDPAAEVRQAACATLAALGGPAAPARLARALGDPSPEVVQAASDGLFALGVDAVPAILDALADARAGAGARDAAIAALVRHGAAAVSPLADGLASALGGASREAAARALGLLGKVAEDALAALLKGLGDSTEGVRAACANAIGFVGMNDETLLAALRAATRDPVPEVRRRAAVAAARLSGRPIDDRGAAEPTPIPIAGFEDGPLTAEAIAEARADVPLSAFVAKLGDGRPVVRANAAAAVATYGAGAAEVADKLGLLLRDGDVEVRRAAGRAFVTLGEAGAGAAFWLLGALGDRDAEVRGFTIAAMAGLHKVAGDFLIEGLRVDREVADATIIPVFARLEGAGVPLLIEALGNGSALIRENAARALERIATKGADAARDALEARLADPVEIVAAAASSALDALDGGRPAPVAALEPDPVPIDGFEGGPLSAEALEGAAEATSLERMLRALRDGRPCVRHNAALVIAQYGADAADAVGPLAVALRDSDALVRQAAARALGRLGAELGGAAPAVLVTALSDKAAEVRRAAREGLTSLGAKATDVLLAGLSRGPDAAEATVLPLLVALGAQARPALVDALEAGAAPVRAAAARGLYLLGRELAAPATGPLQIAAADDDKATRVEVRRALARICGEDDAPAALAAVRFPVDGFDETLLTFEVLDKAKSGFDVAALSRALVDGRVYVRANAALALATLGEEARPVAPALVVAMKDSRAEVRERAARAVIAIGPDRAHAFDLVVALEDASPAVVQVAEQGLLAFADQAIEAYLYALDTIPSIAARSVIPMLVGLGAKAVDPLVTALSHDSPDVRANGLIGLRMLDVKTAKRARAAVSLLSDDEARDVRLQARKTLDYIDGVTPSPLVRAPLPLPLPEFDAQALGPKALAKANKKLKPEALAVLLGDGRRLVRENACRSFELLGVAAPELGLALKDSVASVRLAAAEALRASGQHAAVAAPQLVAALTDRDRDVRRVAREVLVGLGEGAWPALRDGLHVPPDVAVKTVIPVLHGIGAPVVDDIAGALGDVSAFVRLNALGALARLCDQQGAEATRDRVEACLSDPLDSVRRTAQLVLDRLGGVAPAPTTLDVVPMPLDGFDAEVLTEATLKEGMGAKGPLEVAWLTTALSDGRRLVRENAARALAHAGKRADEAVVAALVIGLKDPEGAVRVAAAEALGALARGEAVVVPALANALRGADEALTEAIQGALRAFGPDRVVPALMDSLGGREEHVVEAVAPVARAMPGAFVKGLAGVIEDEARSLVERENAVSVMGALGGDARPAEETLFKLLDDRRGMISVKAIKAMLHVATPGAETAKRLLDHLANDPRPGVHYAIRDVVRFISHQQR